VRLFLVAFRKGRRSVESISLSAELAARIRERIDALGPPPDSGWAPGDWVVRECRETLGALPLHANSIYVWALRPDGTLLRLDHESFRQEVEPETDARRRYGAVAQGARRYPELRELVPVFRAAFLAEQGRTYRTSEVSPELLEQAVRARRVLLVRGADSRAFGSGGVWFRVAAPEDLRSGNELDGVIYGAPVSDGKPVPMIGAFDGMPEFWRHHDETEITRPCGRMLPPQRVRFKKAVARLTMTLLGMMPLTVSVAAAPYRELLRAYAEEDAADGHSERFERVAGCGWATGFGPVIFDPAGEWEAEGKVAPVLEFVGGLPRALGEWLRADATEGAAEARLWYGAVSAADWLSTAVRRWVTDAAWEVQAGEGIPDVWDVEEAAAGVAFFQESRLPPRSEQEQRLRGLLAGRDGTQADQFRRECVAALARNLQRLPGLTRELSSALELASAWADSRAKLRTDAEAATLAADADWWGERSGDAVRGAPFGLPFRLMHTEDPAEVAARMVEAAGATARAGFRAWTQGLVVVREGAEQEAGDEAEEAEVERLLRRARALPWRR